MTDSESYFAWFQAQRELSMDELAGIVQALESLRESRKIHGWRITHAPESPPSVTLEIDATSDEEAVVQASVVFMEALATAGLELGIGVFSFAEAARRTR